MADNQITLIGCGKMGSAMLEGWLGDVSLDARFTIIEPDHSHLGWVANEPRVSLYEGCAAAIAANARASTMIQMAMTALTAATKGTVTTGPLAMTVNRHSLMTRTTTITGSCGAKMASG